MLRLNDLDHHQGSELSHASSTLDKFIYIVNNISQSHVPTAIISFSSLIFLLVSGAIKRRVTKRFPWVQFIPEILICVIVYTILCHLFEWEKLGVKILGNI